MRCPRCNIIVRELPKRSTQQNSFYWFFLGLIEESTGQDANERHEIFKRLFLPPRFVKYKGKEIKLPSSTTGLNKADFGDYLDKISAETGIAIPDPIQADNYIANNDPVGTISPWKRK